MTDLPTLRSRARRALEDALPDRALAIAQEILDQEGWDSETAYIAAVALFRLEDFLRAEELFRRIVARDPSHALAIYYTGRCAERQGRHSEASSLYRTALSLNPDLPEAKEQLGQRDDPKNPGTPLAEDLDNRAWTVGTGPSAGQLLYSARPRLSAFAPRLVGAVVLLVMAFAAPVGASLLNDSVFRPRIEAAKQAVQRHEQAVQRRQQEREQRRQQLREERRQFEERVECVRNNPLDFDQCAPRLNEEPDEESFVESSDELDPWADARLAAARRAAAAFHWTGLVLAALFSVIALYLVGKTMVAWLGSRYEFYERRIDLCDAGFRTTYDSVWLYEIKDAQLSSSPLLALAGTAELTLRTEDRRHRIRGFASHNSMRKLWRELRDAALVERRAMHRWWV